LTTIQEYIKKLEEENLKCVDIAIRLGVSQPMVSIYKRGGNVNLATAKYIYASYGVCIHPYAEESLIYELNKYTKTIQEELEDEDTDI